MPLPEHATEAALRCRIGVAGAGLLLLAVVAALATCAGAAQAVAQGAVRQVFGEWQIRCEMPPGARNEQCALWNQVADKDRANTSLTILVFKTADRKASLIRVIAPPGVLLTSELGLRVDTAELGHIPFRHCMPYGCIANSPLDEQVMKQLRSGQTAVFSIYFSPEQGIGFPVALKGFGEGFDKLP